MGGNACKPSDTSMHISWAEVASGSVTVPLPQLRDCTIPLQQRKQGYVVLYTGAHGLCLQQRRLNKFKDASMIDQACASRDAYQKPKGLSGAGGN